MYLDILALDSVGRTNAQTSSPSTLRLASTITLSLAFLAPPRPHDRFYRPCNLAVTAELPGRTCLGGAASSARRRPRRCACSVLLQFPAHLERTGHAVVQIDAYAAMTGASLFTHVREHLGWTYDRSEDLSRYRDLGAFDYLVTSTPQLFDPARFAKIFATKGFAGLKRWKGIAPWPRFEDKVWVLERAKGGV